MRRAARLFLAAALAAIPGPAQTLLAGLGQAGCPGSNAAIGEIEVRTGCAAPKPCLTDLGLPPVAWAGGAAWDPVREALWVSESSHLALYSLPACLGSCGCQCQKICSFPWPVKSYVTGLALDPVHRILFAADSTGSIYRLDAASCSWSLLGSCRPQLGANEQIGGLAHDRFTETLFYAVSDFAAPAKPPTIYAAGVKNPCAPFCSFPLQGCAAVGPVRGLAFDECRRTLVATDGTNIVFVSWSPPCTARTLFCCHDATANWAGLAVRSSGTRPGLQESLAQTSTSWPCAGAGCPACAPLLAADGPWIGNPRLRLRLDQGPNPTSLPLPAAILLLNLAGRGSTRSLPFPCSPVSLHPTLDGAFWALAAAAGPAPGAPPPCNLSAYLDLFIPVLPELCGHQVAGQWAVVNAAPASWCLLMSRLFLLTLGT